MQSDSPQIAFQRRPLAVDEAVVRKAEFAALVERQSQFVFRVAYSVLRNAPDAEDVVQDTFLKLYRAGAWERIEDERAFLARTAWRIAVERRPRTRMPEAETDLPSHSASPEDSVISSALNNTVHKLIDALPEQLRQPLALSAMEELNSRQIAEVMGISEGTVRTRIMRARQILKQKLAALRGGVNEG